MKIKIYQDSHQEERDGILFDEQFVIDGLNLLLKDKQEAWKIAEDTGHAHPKNPIGFRPSDFGIPQIEELINLFEGA